MADILATWLNEEVGLSKVSPLPILPSLTSPPLSFILFLRAKAIEKREYLC